MTKFKKLVALLTVLFNAKCSLAEISNSGIFQLPQSCAEARGHPSGVQLIHPQPGFGEPFGVYCDQDYEGGGWTVIQNRYDGSVYFYRGWKQYEDGFGSMEGEFWLGLKKIHELTYSKKYELLVLLDDWEGNRAVAKYGRFLVAGPEEKYTLKSVGSYTGTAGDSFSGQVGMKFSTLDAKNDVYKTGNCAVQFEGAWWYSACHGANLNGLYVKGAVTTYTNMIQLWTEKISHADSTCGLRLSLRSVLIKRYSNI